VFWVLDLAVLRRREDVATCDGGSRQYSQLSQRTVMTRPRTS